jgi:uncharacterized membrane protein YkvA (DUF1232 family)
MSDTPIPPDLESKAAAALEAESRTVSPQDVERVIQREAEIRDRFKSSGPLGRYIEDSKLFLAVLKDYWAGTYRTLPFWSISAIVAALLYVLNPFDLIPDMLPIVGQIDDIAVFIACLNLIELDLKKYKTWKLSSVADSTKLG